MRNIRWSVLSAATVAAMGLIMQPAAAAELEEVIVTAVKRDTSLQEVPLSVVAITGDSLENAGIEDFDDLTSSVPSLSLKSSGPGRTKLNIRGISAATGFAPTVSYYIDEMPISTITSGSSTSFAQTVVSPKMFDLKRVEILRGPQGTLFGSSSMGGTVRLITNQPNLDETEGKVGGEISSTSGGGINYRANAMFNLVTGENSALRLVASKTDRDGFIDRVFDDGAGNAGRVEDVDTEETDTFRASFRYQLTDNTYIQPMYFHQKTTMDGKPNFDGPSSNPTTQNRRFDAAEPFADEFEMASITIRSDFENFTLMINASTIDREFTNTEDMTDPIDFLGAPDIFDYGLTPTAAYVDEWVDLEDETFEMRLTSASGADLQWVLGVYSKDAETQADYNMQRGFEFESPLGLANTRDNNKYDETAVFGEVSMDFADSFSFTFGLRALDYSFSQQKLDWGYVYPEAPTEDQANFLDVKASDSEVHYRATVSWNAFEAGHLYLSSSDATRPGGGNRTVPRSTDPADGIAFQCDQELNALGISGNPSSYGGDSVENLELGLKTEPSAAWRINAALYRITWEEIQQRIVLACGFNPTLNAGEAESTGLEVEVVGALSDNLTLTAGFGYTEAEFTQSVPQAGVSSGDRIPDVPEFTAAASVEWSTPYRDGDIFVLGSVNYVDETLEILGSSSTDVAGCCLIESTNVRPDYTLVNLRVGYISDSRWQASIFVDNLTDEEAYFSYSDNIVVPVPAYDRTSRNRPRTIGVSAQFDF